MMAYERRPKHVVTSKLHLVNNIIYSKLCLTHPSILINFSWCINSLSRFSWNSVWFCEKWKNSTETYLWHLSWTRHNNSNHSHLTSFYQLSMWSSHLQLSRKWCDLFLFSVQNSTYTSFLHLTCLSHFLPHNPIMTHIYVNGIWSSISYLIQNTLPFHYWSFSGK
jgi:hypothetical protein